jgi:hypothetical protein
MRSFSPGRKIFKLTPKDASSMQPALSVHAQEISAPVNNDKTFVTATVSELQNKVPIQHKLDGVLNQASIIIEITANIAVLIAFLGLIIDYVFRYEQRKARLAIDFVTITSRFVDLEKLFIEHEELSTLYCEIFNKRGYPKYVTPSKSIRQEQLEFHVCAIMMQLMEDVWTVHDLSRRYKDAEMQGWIRLFNDWTQSNTFKHIWDKMQYVYGEHFRYFINKILATA